MKKITLAALILIASYTSFEVEAQVDADMDAKAIKKEMIEASKNAGTLDSLKEIMQDNGNILIEEAKKAEVEVADDPESLAKGIYGKKKEVINAKAMNQVVNDKTGNLQHVVEQGEHDYDRYKMKIIKDNSLIPVAEAAEDLMEAQAGGRNESRVIAIGDETIKQVETKSCSYTELSKRAEYLCQSTPNISCTDVVKPVGVRGGSVFLPSQEIGKGHWRFFYPENAIASSTRLHEDSISITVPTISQIANVKITSLRYEDQIDISVNGTYIFRGIGPNHYSIVTPSENAFPMWETVTVMVNEGEIENNCGGPLEVGHGNYERLPEIDCQIGGGSFAVKQFKNFGNSTGPEFDITRYLRAGTNEIKIRLAVGNNNGAATDGDVSFDLSFNELCTLGETLERTCNAPTNLTNHQSVSGPVCTGGPQTLTVEGQQYPVQCSKYTETMSGLTAAELIKSPECDALRPPDCVQVKKTCNRNSDLGCEEGSIDYECTKILPKTMVTLSSDQFQPCPDGSCVEEDKAVEKPAFDDMDKLLQAEAKSQGKNPNDLRIFSGVPLTCGKALAIVGLRDCCEDSGAIKGMTTCNADEKQIAMAKEQKLAFRIGTYRTGSNFRRRRHEAWCRFDSMVSKIVAEHVFTNMRNEIDVGGKDNWNCRYITPEMVRKIDFDKIDWQPLKDSLQIEKRAEETIATTKENVIKSGANYKGTRIEKIIEDKIKDRFMDEVEDAH